jgi:hypothetical protein
LFIRGTSGEIWSLLLVRSVQRCEVQILEIHPHVLADDHVVVLSEVVEHLLPNGEERLDADEGGLEALDVLVRGKLSG